MRKVATAVMLLAVGFAIIGCKKGESFDENYTKDVKMTDEQKAQMDAAAAKHPAPGTLTPGQAPPAAVKGAPTGQVDLPKGKGGH